MIGDGRQEEGRRLDGDGMPHKGALELTNPRVVVYAAT